MKFARTLLAAFAVVCLGLIALGTPLNAATPETIPSYDVKANSIDIIIDSYGRVRAIYTRTIQLNTSGVHDVYVKCAESVAEILNTECSVPAKIKVDSFLGTDPTISVSFIEAPPKGSLVTFKADVVHKGTVTRGGEFQYNYRSVTDYLRGSLTAEKPYIIKNLYPIPDTVEDYEGPTPYKATWNDLQKAVTARGLVISANIATAKITPTPVVPAPVKNTDKSNLGSSLLGALIPIAIACAMLLCVVGLLTSRREKKEKEAFTTQRVYEDEIDRDAHEAVPWTGNAGSLKKYEDSGPEPVNPPPIVYPYGHFEQKEVQGNLPADQRVREEQEEQHPRTPQDIITEAAWEQLRRTGARRAIPKLPEEKGPPPKRSGALRGWDETLT